MVGGTSRSPVKPGATREARWLRWTSGLLLTLWSNSPGDAERALQENHER